MWNRKVFIRILEVLLCIGCVVALRVTDDESRRVFHYLRNRSREWSSILNNVTWGAIGAALATATCGGYLIITAGLLIAAATSELNGRKTEIFLLSLGVILFGIVGALSLASIENVPQDLIDNGAVLGALCLATALLFIADLLISPPTNKKQPNAAQIFSPKDAAKRQITTTVTSEKESKLPKAAKNDSVTNVETTDENGVVNGNFEREEDERQEQSNSVVQPSKPERLEKREESPKPTQMKSNGIMIGDPRVFGDVEKEQKEYTQNFENRRMQKDSLRYLEPEKMRRDFYEIQERNNDGSKIVYKGHDIYQRPVDEIDTPLFPTTHLGQRSEPYFAKLVNPSVKIMRFDRNVQENLENYRHSDSSQYDNVPIRMRGPSTDLPKRTRDVSFNVPPPPTHKNSDYKLQYKNRDEIEMLEECFGALRTTSTGTQTKTPSSPNDPGYVLHTASNWPRDLHSKPPSSSPK